MKTVIARSEATKQSSFLRFVDCFATLAMTDDRLRVIAPPSCPRLSRASTSYFLTQPQDVDGRDKPGHDDECFFSYFTTAAVWPNNSLRSSSVRIAGWP